MATPAGRGIRIVAGIAMMVIGLFVVRGTGGIVLALFGIVPFVAGALNFCTVAPLVRAPFWGRDTGTPPSRAMRSGTHVPLRP